MNQMIQVNKCHSQISLGPQDMEENKCNMLCSANLNHKHFCHLAKTAHTKHFPFGTHLESIEQDKYYMEYHRSALYESGYSETPSQSQQWGENGNILADPYNYGYILRLGTTNRGSLSVESHHQNHNKIDSHNDQGWDGKCKKGFGIVPIKPAGFLTYIALFWLCDCNCGDSNDQWTPIANCKANGHHARLHHSPEDDQHSINDEQCFEEHPEKKREVEKVTEKCHCNTQVVVLILSVKGRAYNEPHISSEQ